MTGADDDNSTGRRGIPTLAFRIGFGLHLALVLVIAVGAYLGALPPALGRVPHLDTAGHFALIGLLAFFLDGALRFRPLWRGGPRWLRLGPALVLVVAAVEEAAQVLSPNRTASARDLAADLVGILLLSWIARRLARR